LHEIAFLFCLETTRNKLDGNYYAVIPGHPVSPGVIVVSWPLGGLDGLGVLLGTIVPAKNRSNGDGTKI